MSRKSSAKSKRGLPARFVSRQTQTLEASSKGIDSKLADLQRESERIAKERAELAARQATAPEAALVELATLAFDASAQSRVFVDPQVVSDYVERMSWDAEKQVVVDPEGASWPAVLVFDDGERKWVADGFHRAAAAREAGIEQLQCEVRPGSLRDAVCYSLSANARHGLRRTREDKRRAVQRALEDQEWRLWTDARIAKLCSVSRPFVSNLRETLEVEGQIPIEIALYGADDREFERDVEAIQTRRAEYEQATSTSSRQNLSVVVSNPPPTSAPAREVAAPEENTTRQERVVTHAWGELDVDALEEAEVLVLYPASAAHYEMIAAWLQRGEHEVEVVITPTMSGSPWFWKGPALFDGLTEVGFGQPQLCQIDAFGKHFTVWFNTAFSSGGAGELDLEALRQREHVAIIGQVLDPW